MSDTALVAGVGPGIGAACTRRFVDAGFTVGAAARSEAYLDDLAADVDGPGRVVPVPTDLTDPESVRAGVERLRDEAGTVDLLVYNAATAQGTTPFLETDWAEMEAVWQIDVQGLFECAKAVLPAMIESGGTVVVTGSILGPRGHAQLIPQCARGAQRNLTMALAKEFAADGVHVAYAVIDGYVDREPHRESNPNKPDEEWIDPDGVAETYHRLHEQPPSAWTFQVDLRPYGGGFEAY